jgi:hypothetical protein
MYVRTGCWRKKGVRNPTKLFNSSQRFVIILSLLQAVNLPFFTTKYKAKLDLGPEEGMV